MSTRISKTTALIPLLALGATFFLSSERTGHPAAGSSATSPGAGGRYIGATKCKSCHSSDESGDPYGAWSEAKHSHAFEALQTAQAKELAAPLDVADPAEHDACVACHVTGFGEPEDSFARGWKQELGVQCETCHGPGEDHMKARFKAAAMGKSKGYEPVPEGEIRVTPEVGMCVECHNPKSPSYEPFCYFEARAKIAHLDPRKPRTDQEQADYGKCPSGDPCQHAEGCPDGRCNLTPEQMAAMKE